MHRLLQKIIGYDVPLDCMALCNYSEDNVQGRDRYLVKILVEINKLYFLKSHHKAMG